jgi:hypothetical protein
MQEQVEGAPAFLQMSCGLTAMMSLYLWSSMAKEDWQSLDCRSKVAERITLFKFLGSFLACLYCCLLRVGGVAVVQPAPRFPKCVRKGIP